MTLVQQEKGRPSQKYHIVSRRNRYGPGWTALCQVHCEGLPITPSSNKAALEDEDTCKDCTRRYFAYHGET